jgi:Amt family ammonium transporter
MRISERDTRRYFGAYFGGKMIGVGVILLGMWAIAWYFSTSAGATMLGQEAPPMAAEDLVNPVNTMWVLVATFLVFFMQAGFMALEAGFARTREVSNIMLECIADTCLCGLLFWAFGFAFMFGAGNGFIGHEFFFLNNAPATYGTTGVAFLAFFLFQFAFADTCSTITSGAMVGRTAFGGDLLSALV